MRNLNPISNTGVVIRKDVGTFLGTCFVFRYPNVFLTAGHCVRSLDPAAPQLRLPSTGNTNVYEVEAIIRHDSADVAVLHAQGVSEGDITWPQYRIFDDRAWGEEYMTCGFPQEYSDLGPNPIPRVFKGWIQRFFPHVSHLGYKYVAAELSSGCPQGLSGAAVFNPRFHGRLLGMVTENLKTTTELKSILEVEENGKTFREHYHNVINYGVALWLPSISNWIDIAVPPVPQEELNRRAANQQPLREANQ